MKKGGLTAAAVEEQLRKLNGNLAAVGRAFGVTRQAVHEFCKKRPKLKAAADDCREAMKDNAESVLYKAVLKGEAWAVCFFLKTQAKDRGYVERQEVAGKHDHLHAGADNDEKLKIFRQRYGSTTTDRLDALSEAFESAAARDIAAEAAEAGEARHSELNGQPPKPV